MTERNPVFDMMKGVAIFLMVLGHCQIPDSLHHGIYLFHIPMFFMVSGYFYKPKDVKLCLKTDLKRLIFPYGIFVAVVFLKFLLDAFRLQDFSTPVRFGKSILTGDFGVGPIWFLLALFWCREIFNAAAKWKWGIPLLGITSVAVGAWGLNVDGNLAFLVGISAVVFYAIGFAFSKKQRNVTPLVAGICFVISVGVFFACGEMDVHTMRYPVYPLNVLGALTSTIFLYWLLNVGTRVIWVKNFLAFFGRWSLLLLGVHYAEFMLFDWYAKIPDAALVAVVRLVVDAGVTWGLSRIPTVKKIFF
ncbi:MAG: acyltransferase family protein [Fibrobacter sp.]|nr:acyltransferase family protein [Fibrobacter sp.]